MVYKGKYILTIQKEHVGKLYVEQKPCHCCGRGFPPISFSFMGGVLSTDVGKQVYKDGDTYTVENDEQRDKRISANK